MSIRLPADWWILLVSSLLVAGVVMAAFATRLRLPGLLLFLTLGMMISDDGLRLVSLADPRAAQIGGTAALLLILYEGGLTTKPRDLRQAALPGLLLATVAVVVTAAVTGAGVYLLLDVEPMTAFLVGAVVASTDAAAVFAVPRCPAGWPPCWRSSPARTTRSRSCWPSGCWRPGVPTPASPTGWSSRSARWPAGWRSAFWPVWRAAGC